MVRAAAPAGFSQAIAARIHVDVQHALSPVEQRASFAAQGFEPRDLGPEALGRQMQDDLARWGEVIRTSGIRAD
jgi:tripartite-type tricarboxylate transporter receptor subunit TctC